MNLIVGIFLIIWTASIIKDTIKTTRAFLKGEWKMTLGEGLKAIELPKRSSSFAKLKAVLSMLNAAFSNFGHYVHYTLLLPFFAIYYGQLKFHIPLSVVVVTLCAVITLFNFWTNKRAQLLINTYRQLQGGQIVLERILAGQRLNEVRSENMLQNMQNLLSERIMPGTFPIHVMFVLCKIGCAVYHAYFTYIFAFNYLPK